MTPRTNVLFRTCYHACCFNHECIVLVYIFNDLFSCSHRQSLYGVDLSNKVVVSLATSSVIGLSRKSPHYIVPIKTPVAMRVGLAIFSYLFPHVSSTWWPDLRQIDKLVQLDCLQKRRYAQMRTIILLYFGKKTNGRNSNDIFKVDKYISNTQFTKYSQCVLIQMIFQHSNEIVKVHGPF